MGTAPQNKSGIVGFLSRLGNDIKDIGVTFVKGNWMTKISYLIMGFGQICRKQIARGLAFLAAEVAFIIYMMNVGVKYLKDFGTLGTVETHDEIVNVMGMEMAQRVYGDNSFFILLYSIMSIIVILAFVYLWRINIRQQKEAEDLLAAGKSLPTNRADLHSLLDNNFDKTLLALPVLGVVVFLVIPILFMICVAFTNYDKNHQSPTNLFTWVGFDNFKNLFQFGTTGFGSTFFAVLGWTLVWAFFATFLTYFGGIGVALLINKKGVKFKKLWRTIFVLTIAVPQFVSLLYVGKMFATDGLVNTYFMKWGWINSPIPFWEQAALARPIILLINLWIGTPYVMLIATGLLMNIPEDLYESARIDGANPFQMFMKITMPYMFFVTGPYLLTTFTGNINNFNVIYLLTQGKPQSMQLAEKAGYTDLLITWLYKMTVNDTNYRMAAVLGIMVFVVVAGISLIVYNVLPSVKDEEGFQ